MVHFTTRSFALLIMSLALLSTLAAPAMADPGGNAANAAKCENGGYLNYTDADGNPFANTGECVRSAAQGGTLVLTRCAEEALSAGYDPAAFNLVAGTDDDNSGIGSSGGFDGNLTFGPDLICGFGGNDHIFTLPAEDVFLGGEGNDDVYGVFGIFYGGPGDDLVEIQDSGIFSGGPGNDRIAVLNGGTFNGEDGDDRITRLDAGTFNGGPGDDWTRTLNGGIFNGGAGNDTVSLEGEGGAIPSGMFGGYFNGGEGDDTIYHYQGGDYTSVESVLIP